ncbi:MAG TPA: nucleotide exchange factor GrpE [Verrucomicrobiae bacterium]|nr:nucleotide exchange factor GrpE [Verrucomicrobiae bacterium]
MKKTSSATEKAKLQAAIPALPEASDPGEAAPAAPEDVEDLKTRAAKADEHWNRLLRTTADFDNFKKRAAREKQDAVRYGNETLIQKLLPILDNFDMALAAAQTSPADPSSQSVQTGIAMIHQQLRNILLEAGLEEVEASGQKFDPNWHEAVSQQETAEIPEGQVLHQVRKGYKLRDRLLRPASVVVAKAPAPDSSQ